MQQERPPISPTIHQMFIVSLLFLFFNNPIEIDFQNSEEAKKTECIEVNRVFESMHESHAESEERNEERLAFFNEENSPKNIVLPKFYIIQNDKAETIYDEVIPHPPESLS